MIDPEFDKDGYPTEATLQAVRQWLSSGDAHDKLLAFVAEAWSLDHGRLDTYARSPSSNNFERFVFVTGGWSGNEDLISAMQENRRFWRMCWYQTTRGGKYEFRIGEGWDL